MPPQSPKPRLKIDQQALGKFLSDELAPKLKRGCDAGAEFASELAPVDTGRLFSSARGVEPVVEGKCIRSGIRFGGIASRGIYKEQTFLRDIDYSLSVEVRTPFLRPALPEIGDRIVDGLKRND